MDDDQLLSKALDHLSMSGPRGPEAELRWKFFLQDVRSGPLMSQLKASMMPYLCNKMPHIYQLILLSYTCDNHSILCRKENLPDPFPVHAPPPPHISASSSPTPDRIRTPSASALPPMLLPATPGKQSIFLANDSHLQLVGRRVRSQSWPLRSADRHVSLSPAPC